MAQQVVARFQDGRLVKGTSMDIDPDKPFCHVRPPDGPAVQVVLADLKALFFVRTLDGNPEHREALTADPTDPRARGATLVRIEFADGEAVVGMVIRFPPVKQYFYVTPADPQSNNTRMLINRNATVSIEPA
jgi:hypothetical protein